MLDRHLVFMAQMLEAYKAPGASVLDVGSLDVNGNFRELVTNRKWTYTGLDLAPGKNVDVVAEDQYSFPVADGAHDIVISGSTMEHVERVWLWVPELVRCLRPGGLLAIITHWQFIEHRFPVDCWRIMPDGMKVLFDDTGALEKYNIQIVSETDITGSAWRIQ